ncbi:hypothetical protein HPP92_003640 [Vanilla planifolia]|uniref:HMA domain-containing protein n=1 Tax=Vanilla planifolia TaxID=51239 RepID=A0A835SH29_VANPL|nr:hypothetical protein HPP92_003640 [Vanilla planifolia]
MGSRWNDRVPSQFGPQKQQAQEEAAAAAAECGAQGVKSVDVNLKQQKVTVTGYVEPNKVLKKVQSTGKKAEMWPYVPYNLISQPYAAQVYDKKAPPGYVRNAEVGSINNQGANRRIN